MLKLNEHKQNTIFSYRAYTNKSGCKSTKKKVVDRNRCGNPKSISISEAIKRLLDKKELPIEVKQNIEALIEMRDNSIHFVNMVAIQKPVQELGFACIKNYILLLKKWQPQSSLHKYNLYLMPLAYIDTRQSVTGAITRESQNFITTVRDMMNIPEPSDEFYVAIRVGVQFHKGNSFEGTPVKYGKDGEIITLSEEDMRQKFPLDHKGVTTKARQRYADFKEDKRFHTIMRDVKRDNKLCYERRLDPQKPKSGSKCFFSTNIWQKLDQYYTRK